VFVKRRGECGVVRIDKVIEFSGWVSDVPRVGNINLNLEILIDLRHLEENVDNGGEGSGEKVSIEKVGK